LNDDEAGSSLLKVSMAKCASDRGARLYIEWRNAAIVTWDFSR